MKIRILLAFIFMGIGCTDDDDENNGTGPSGDDWYEAR